MPSELWYVLVVVAVVGGWQTREKWKRDAEFSKVIDQLDKAANDAEGVIIRNTAKMKAIEPWVISPGLERPQEESFPNDLTDEQLRFRYSMMERELKRARDELFLALLRRDRARREWRHYPWDEDDTVLFDQLVRDKLI